jgi:hypothetical protein
VASFPSSGRGHAKPNVTLPLYAHLFQTSDEKAGAAINTALTTDTKSLLRLEELADYDIADSDPEVSS